jgi:hypothetical protein
MSRIWVSVDHGTLDLSGYVTTFYDHMNAEEDAGPVRGA